MRALAALATLTLACAGANPTRPTQRPESPTPRTRPSASQLTSCPDCPPSTPPSCPEPSACPLLYSNTQGWHCIDDPEVKGSSYPELSYCWYERADCEYAYQQILKERTTIKPCRSQTPAYCYDKYSSLLQYRRSSCAATMKHCEGNRLIDSREVLPEEGYVFSPCTEQP